MAINPNMSRINEQEQLRRRKEEEEMRRRRAEAEAAHRPANPAGSGMGTAGTTRATTTTTTGRGASASAGSSNSAGQGQKTWWQEAIETGRNNLTKNVSTTASGMKKLLEAGKTAQAAGTDSRKQYDEYINRLTKGSTDPLTVGANWNNQKQTSRTQQEPITAYEEPAAAEEKKTTFEPMGKTNAFYYDPMEIPKNTYGQDKREGNGARTALLDPGLAFDQERVKRITESLSPLAYRNQMTYSEQWRNAGLWDGVPGTENWRKSDKQLAAESAVYGRHIDDINSRLAGADAASITMPTGFTMPEGEKYGSDQEYMDDRVRGFADRWRRDGIVQLPGRYGMYAPYTREDLETEEGREELAESMYRYFFGEAAAEEALAANGGVLSQETRNEMMGLLTQVDSLSQEERENLEFQRDVYQAQKDEIDQQIKRYNEYGELLQTGRDFITENGAEGGYSADVDAWEAGTPGGIFDFRSGDKAAQIYSMFGEDTNQYNKIIGNIMSGDEELMNEAAEAFDHAIFYLPEDVEIFQAYMNAGDREGALAFHQGLVDSGILNYRYMTYKKGLWTYQSDRAPIVTGAASVVTQQLTPLEGIGNVIGNAVGDKTAADPNSWHNMNTAFTQAIRGNIAGNAQAEIYGLTGSEMAGKMAGQAAYGLFSAADNVAQFAIGKGLANKLLKAGLIAEGAWQGTAQAASLAQMYGTVFQNSYLKALEDTEGDANYAMATGALDGAIEIAFETVLGADVPFMEGMSPARFGLYTYLGELIEEEGGNLTEPIVNSIKDNIAEYLTEGKASGKTQWDRDAIALAKENPEKYSGADGRKQAYMDVLKGFGEDLLWTAFSTAVSTGPQAFGNYKRMGGEYETSGKTIASNEQTMDVAEMAAASENEDTRKRGEKIRKRLEGGKKVSNKEIGALHRTLAMENNERIRDVSARVLNQNVRNFIRETYGDRVDAETQGRLAEIAAKATTEGEKSLNFQERSLLRQYPAARDLVNDMTAEERGEQADPMKRSSQTMETIEQETRTQTSPLEEEAAKLGEMVTTKTQKAIRSLAEYAGKVTEKAKTAVKSAAEKMASPEEIGNVLNRMQAMAEESRASQAGTEAAGGNGETTARPPADVAAHMPEGATDAIRGGGQTVVNGQNRGGMPADVAAHYGESREETLRKTVVYDNDDGETEAGEIVGVKTKVEKAEQPDGTTKGTVVTQYVVRDSDGTERTVDAAGARAADEVTAAAMNYIEISGLDDRTATDLLDVVKSRKLTKDNVEAVLKDARNVMIRGSLGMAFPEQIGYDVETAQALYRKGQAAAAAAEESRKAGAGETTNAKGTLPGSRLRPGNGKIDFRNVNPEDLDGDTRKQVDAAAEIARRVGFNLIFENDTKNTNRFGEYDAATGSVVLNIAGTDKDGSGHHLLVAMSHEVTHLLEHNSPEGYRALREFVFKEMRRNGVDLVARVSQKMDNYNYQINKMRENGETLSDVTIDGAVAEVVADACDQVLGNEKLIRKLEGENPSLYKKIKNYVSDFVQRVKEAARGMRESGSIDSVYIRDMDELAKKWGIALEEVQGRAGQNAAEAEQEGKTGFGSDENAEQKQLSVLGEDPETGRTIYLSNFPANTNKLDKAEHGIKLIQDVWSKNKIPLRVFDGTNKDGRIIYAQFDPDYDSSGKRMTDAGKIVRGNRIGSRSERRMAINLLDDYIDILEESDYHSSEPNREGHNPQTHEGVKAWHYFVDDLYYVDQGSDEMIPFRMEIDIKEKDDGTFVYNFGGKEIKGEQRKRLSVPQYKTAGSNPQGNAHAQSGIIINDTTRDNNIKSGQTQQSLAEADAEYAQAVENGDTDKAKRMVDEAAEAAFADSKARTGDGKLMPIFHGTKADFNIFDTNVSGGSNGTAEGFGIYLTDNPDVSSAYGNRQISGYVNMERPARSDKKTIKRAELAKLIKAACEKEAQELVNDGSYSSVNEAIQDTWISNYVYTPEYRTVQDACKAVADSILSMNDNDMDIVQEIMSGMAIRDYGDAMEFYQDVLTPTTGIDGFWTTWRSERDGSTANVLLAFDSSQIKSNEYVTYDDQGNVIPLSERFNTEKKDIRFSLAETSEIQEKQAELNTLRGEIKEIENSEEYQQALEAGMKGDFEPYNAMLEKTGLPNKKRRLDALQKEIQDWQKEWNDQYDREQQEKKAAAIQKSGLEPEEYRRKAAVKEFGYTTDYREAGYLLPNGKMLNFSGEKGRHYGSRGQDHRAISTIYDGENMTGSEAMVAFMSDGNIRCMPETPGMDIGTTTEPTREQYNAIRNIVNQYGRDGYFAIDLTDAEGQVTGTLEYEGRVSADRVLNDLKTFFKTGEIPQQSGLSRFFSLAEEGPSATEWLMALDPNDMDAFVTGKEKTMVRNYQKARNGITETEARIQDMKARLKDAKGDEARKLRINIQTEQNRLARARKQLTDLTGGTEYASVLKQAQQSIDFLMGAKSQEQIRNAADSMRKRADDMRRTAEEAARSLATMADREQQTVMRRMIDQQALKQNAQELNRYFGLDDQQRMEDGLAAITLKMESGDQTWDKSLEEMATRILNEVYGGSLVYAEGGIKDQDAYSGQLSDIMTQLIQATRRILPGIPGQQSASVQTEIRNLTNYVSTVSDITRQSARGMEKVAQMAEGLKTEATKTEAAAADIRRKLAMAIRYYDTINRQSDAQASADKLEAAIRTIESQAAQRILEEQNKWAHRLENDRNVRRLANENLRVRKKINTAYSRMAKLILNESDQQNIPEHMKPIVRAALRMILDNDAGGNRKITGQDWQSLMRSKQTMDLIDRRDGTGYSLDSLVDFEGLDSGGDDVAVAIEEALKQIEDGIGFWRGGRGRNAVSLEGDKAALEKIQQGMSRIYDIATRSRQVFLEGQLVSAANAAYEVDSEAKKKEVYQEFVGGLGRLLKGLDRNVRLGNMTPEYFFKNLKNNGLTRIYNEFKTAEDMYGRILLEAKRKIAEAAEKNHYSQWDMSQKKTLKLENGKDVSLTLEQLMALRATWKREKTLGPEMSSHLEKGGFIIEQESEKKVIGREARQTNPIRVTAADMAEAEKLLTDEQKAYVDELVRILSQDMGAYGNEASMRMYGIEKYKEKYYFPFRVWDGVKNKASNTGGAVNPTNNNRAAHQSFTNRRKANASNAVLIRDFTETCAEHINQMATYATFGTSIENMNRVLNFRVTENAGDPANVTERNVETILRERYGDNAINYLRDFMKDLNGGAVQQNSGLAQSLMSMFKKNAVGGSLSVAMQQPLSYIRASTMIDTKYLAGALNPKYYRGSYNEMLQHSGVAVIKDMGKFDMNFSRGATEWLAPEAREDRAKRVYKKTEKYTNILPELADQATWTRMWSAIKIEQHEAHPGMDMSSDEFLDMVGKRFNDVMRRTQVYDSVLVKSQLMRKQDWVSKSITAFRAEPTLSLNMFMDALINRKEAGGKKNAAAVAATFLLSAIAQAAVKGIMSAGRSPDEKKTLAENFAYRFAGTFISEANPLGLIPGYDNIVDAFSGNDINDNAWGMLTTFGKTLSKIWNPPAGDDLTPESGWRYVEDTVGQIAQMFTGVPAKNLMRDSRAAYNILLNNYSASRDRKGTDEQGNETIVPARGNSGAVMKYQMIDQLSSSDLMAVLEKTLGISLWDSSNTAYMNRIYEAEKAGRTEEAAALREYMTAGKGKTEKSIDSAVASAAKKDEDTGTMETAEFLLEGGYADKTTWITQQYKEGNLTDEELRELYRKYFPDKDPKGTIWEAAKEKYLDGDITRKQAEDVYRKTYPDANADDVWQAFDIIDYKNETGKTASGAYYRLHDAIEQNSSEAISKAVDTLMAHGKKKNGFKSSIETKWKDTYIGMQNGSAEKVKLRDGITKAMKAAGHTAKEIDKMFANWTKK